MMLPPQDRIADQVVDEQQSKGVRRYGLAEYVGGGYLAIERFKNGENLHPLGVAMLRAVADWHRLGFDSMPEFDLGWAGFGVPGCEDPG